MFNTFRNASDTIEALKSADEPINGASIIFSHIDEPEDSNTDELGSTFEPWEGDDWNAWRRNAIAELAQDVQNRLSGDHFRYMIVAAHLELLG